MGDLLLSWALFGGRPTRRSLSLIPLASVLALVVAACATGGGSQVSEARQEKVEIRYSFDWVPDSDWAAIVWADELGYFAEEGISVDYRPGDPQLMQVLASNEVDIAQVPGPQTVLGFSEGLPITVVGVQLPESPLVLLADRDKGIVEPKDIEGNKVAVQAGEFEGFVWEAWAKAQGIDRSEVEEVPAGGTADVLFVDHQVDVFMDFYTSGAMVELTKGREGREKLFLIRDTLDIIGQSQVVHNDFLSEHPEAVRGFLKAWARGAKYAIDHPEETVELILEKFTELERPAVEWSTARYLEAWQSDQPRSGGLLSFTPAMWNSTKEVLVNADLMEEMDISEMYTDEFLPNPPIFP
jgi:NitT/TauT family transport system substrate-binding protein